MNIQGLERFSTIDYPGKLACTLFISGCNFRCGYCHNPDLVLKANSRSSISEESILEFLDQRRGLLEGVCITGGEPLTTLDLNFLEKIKNKGFAVKIDTNGSYPDRLQEAINAGLVDYIAMDLKASRELYPDLVGHVDLNKIEQSMQIISDFKKYEFRTTVVPGFHTLENLQQMRDWVLETTWKKRLQAYYIQGFIARLGGMLDPLFENISSPKQAWLEEIKRLWLPYVDICEIR